jgi:hypothetical protein
MACPYSLDASGGGAQSLTEPAGIAYKPFVRGEPCDVDLGNRPPPACRRTRRKAMGVATAAADNDDDDGDDFAAFVVRTFLYQYALAADATEAAAFRVDRSSGGGRGGPGRLRVLAHLSGDDQGAGGDDERRREAIRAFEAIVAPCLEGKPGAIEVGPAWEPRDPGPAPGAGPQYCLVVPFPRHEPARLVFCLITRAPRPAAARAVLHELLGR